MGEEGVENHLQFLVTTICRPPLTVLVPFKFGELTGPLSLNILSFMVDSK